MDDQLVIFKLEPSSPGELSSSMLDPGSDDNEICVAMEEGCEVIDTADVGSDDGSMDQVVIIMDIKEPLTTLRSLLEKKVDYSLENCSFSLQESQILDHDKNLVDLCEQGEGIVQINCELRRTATEVNVNIADVLKPAEEYVEMDGDRYVSTRWIVDQEFKKFQESLGIPHDPCMWSVRHVRHWLMWSVRQFSLCGIRLSDWEMTGAELLEMSKEEFEAKVPENTDKGFWTHFELLKACKIVAIGHKDSDLDEPNSSPAKVNDTSKEIDPKLKPQDRVFRMSKNDDENEVVDSSIDAGSGPIQLWQFLLELLTNKNHREAIQWLEEEGEFKLVNPELVAQMWGSRKNKPTMNYEKLSRALRYYYDGEMISKVNGKRFVYKFVCDLKQLIGYSANELNARVIEAELHSKAKEKKDDEETSLYVNDFITFVQ